MYELTKIKIKSKYSVQIIKWNNFKIVIFKILLK